MNREHLGDGVYVRDGSFVGEVVLSVNDHRNEVVTLGPRVLAALDRFRARSAELIRDRQPADAPDLSPAALTLTCCGDELESVTFDVLRALTSVTTEAGSGTVFLNYSQLDELHAWLTRAKQARRSS